MCHIALVLPSVIAVILPIVPINGGSIGQIVPVAACRSRGVLVRAGLMAYGAVFALAGARPQAVRWPSGWCSHFGWSRRALLAPAI